MRRLTIATALAGAVLLAGCGPQASPQEVVASSAEATQEAGSANMSMEMRMEGAQPLTMTADGAFDFASGQGAMTMNLGALGEQMGMGEIEMRTDGTTMYMKMPPQMGAPTPWVSTDLKNAAGVGGLGQLGQLNNNDPRGTMDMLRGVAEVEEVGREEVRGTEPTHYTAVVDLNKALEDAPEESKQALQQQLKMLGTSDLPIDVWIDDDGLLRRQDMTMDLSKAAAAGGAPAGQGPAEMFMRMELFDFGTEVDVAPPPADQVTDMAKLQGGG
jgi:LppX_LprAFG lipoprotein